MSKIFNKRNAVLGWLAWAFGKRAARRKLASRRGVTWLRSHTLAVGAVAASLAAIAAGAAAAFARRPDGPDELPSG